MQQFIIMNCTFYISIAFWEKSWIENKFYNTAFGLSLFNFNDSSNSVKHDNDVFQLDLKWYKEQHLYTSRFFDSELNFVKQVNIVVKTSFYYLRLISKIKPMLSSRDLEIIIHAFISSRLDSCNVVHLGISQSLVNQLQLVQNAALCCSSLLPVRYRSNFKALVIFVFILNCLAPLYLSDLVTLHKPDKNLRSADKQWLQVARSLLKRKGDRAFRLRSSSME